jgi:hypothetical protein
MAVVGARVNIVQEQCSGVTIPELWGKSFRLRLWTAIVMVLS